MIYTYTTFLLFNELVREKSFAKLNHVRTLFTYGPIDDYCNNPFDTNMLKVRPISPIYLSPFSNYPFILCLRHFKIE